MIEALAGGRVRHCAATHENVAMTVRDQLRARRSGERSGAAAASEGIPREVQEALVLDHLGRHYRKWLDEPIPALSDRTPREAARDHTLRPELVNLIRGLEGMYQQALKEEAPAYDPSWMWSELGIEERSAPAYPPLLAHERMASMMPGIGELCRTAAERVRMQPGIDDVSTIVTAEEIGTNLEIQRFLRERQGPPQGPREDAAASLAAHVQFMTNFELHRRKTFWVDDSLAYMLAKTDLDVPGSEVRVPFASFALVFTDRHVLSLAERMLSAGGRSPLAGHFLRVATVYVSEERTDANRILRVGIALDALGADPPHLVVHEILLAEDAQIALFLDSLGPQVVTDPPVPDSNPLRGLLHVTLNAILYATSAGVAPELRRSPGGAERMGSRPGTPPLVFSS
ncbi:MAG TPA: hypothetical protein VGQ19_15240, partial [Burkholderiales bacterium]|nr:hypothetical protein [Burkholderiales bacterium]